MKLSLTVLVTVAYCAPEKKKRKTTNERFTIPTPAPPVPCSTAPHEIVWSSNGPTNTGSRGGSPFTSVDNGQNGQITFDSYESNAYCFVDIGTSCGNEERK